MSQRLSLPERNKHIRDILRRSRKIKDFRKLYHDPVVDSCLDDLVNFPGLTDKERYILKIKLLDTIGIFGDDRRKVDQKDFYVTHPHRVAETLWELYRDPELVFIAYSHDDLEKIMEQYPYEKDIFNFYLNRMIVMFESLGFDTTNKEFRISIEDALEVTSYLTIKPEQDYYNHLGEVSEKQRELSKNDLSQEAKEEFEKKKLKCTISKIGDSYDNQSTLFKEVNEDNYRGLGLKLRGLKVRLGERLSIPPDKLVELYKTTQKWKTRFNRDFFKYITFLAVNETGSFLKKPRILDDLAIIRSCYKAINIIDQTRRDFAEYDKEERKHIIKEPKIKLIYDRYVNNQLRVIQSLLGMLRGSGFYSLESDYIKNIETMIEEEYHTQDKSGIPIFFRIETHDNWLASGGATIRFHQILMGKRNVYGIDKRKRFKEIYRDLLVQYYWILGYKENNIWYKEELGSDLEERVNGNPKEKNPIRLGDPRGA